MSDVVTYDNTTCPNCISMFRTPKILQCSHCLCLECITKMFAFQILKKEVEMSPSNIKARKIATNNITIQCPTCGEDTTLSKDCILDKELKTNENLADLCEKLRHLGIVCESCNEKQANTKCLNCDVAFCEPCFDEN